MSPCARSLSAPLSSRKPVRLVCFFFCFLTVTRCQPTPRRQTHPSLFPHSAAASNSPRRFSSPPLLASDAASHERFPLFPGELSSNSSETSGRRSSCLSALLCSAPLRSVFPAARRIWKAAESQFTSFIYLFFPPPRIWTEEVGSRRSSLVCKCLFFFLMRGAL